MKWLYLLLLVLVLAGGSLGLNGTGVEARNFPVGKRVDNTTPREEYSTHRVIETMDEAGAVLGDELSHLKGAAFEGAYLEHARHIQKAQQRARQLSQSRDD